MGSLLEATTPETPWPNLSLIPLRRRLLELRYIFSAKSCFSLSNKKTDPPFDFKRCIQFFRVNFRKSFKLFSYIITFIWLIILDNEGIGYIAYHCEIRPEWSIFRPLRPPAIKKLFLS